MPQPHYAVFKYYNEQSYNKATKDIIEFFTEKWQNEYKCAILIKNFLGKEIKMPRAVLIKWGDSRKIRAADP